MIFLETPSKLFEHESDQDLNYFTKKGEPEFQGWFFVDDKIKIYSTLSFSFKSKKLNHHKVLRK